jgi:protein TonB
MKRKNEKVPEFDEIIFENRNKVYGAYDLRKRYKSAASLSILGGIVFSSILISILSFTARDGKASIPPTTVVLMMSDPVTQKVAPPPELKQLAKLTNNTNNLKPEVTEDTSNITAYLPSTEELLTTVQNGSVTDTAVFTVTTETVTPEESEPRIIVQEMPEFPGGFPALMNFIGSNMKYPAEAQNNNIQGKVLLKFVVKPDGSVDRIEILRGIDPLLDNEAIRVVKTLPKFKPGRQDGVAVPVWFLLPVVFKIESK